MNPTPTQRGAIERLASRLATELRNALEGVPMDRQHGLSYRVKLDSAITRKIERKHLSSWHDLNDLIGLRVVVLNLDAIPRARDVVLQWAHASQLTVAREDDRFTAPGVGGYRALHIDLRGRGPDPGQDLPIGIEVQITTWLQHLHAIISHSTYYAGEQPRPSAGLERLSRLIHRLDKVLARMFSGIANYDGRS